MIPILSTEFLWQSYPALFLNGMEKMLIFFVKQNKFELVLAGFKNPSTDAVNKFISKVELAKHCKRLTREPEKTVRLIEDLIRFLRDSTDTRLGVPLLREDVWDIWKEEKRHIACIQDPECYQLYTKTGGLSEGGVLFPVFRFDRGTTSLESFHSHLKIFIPGMT